MNSEFKTCECYPACTFHKCDCYEVHCMMGDNKYNKSDKKIENREYTLDEFRDLIKKTNPDFGE